MDEIECGMCNGTGKRRPLGSTEPFKDCADCDGTGYIND